MNVIEVDRRRVLIRRSAAAMGIPVVRVEGNMGAGKSSLLRELQDLAPEAAVLSEPVEGWTYHLEGLYASGPERSSWRLPMQAIAMCTRAESVVKALSEIPSHGQHRVLVTERSNTSADIFARATLTDRDMTAYETLSDRYRDALASAFSKLGGYETATVYLRTTPRVCAERVRGRARRAEDGISLEYIRRIHELHEEAFADADLVVDCDNMGKAEVAEVVSRFLQGLSL